MRGEFKAPKSVRGIRGVPLAGELAEALDSLRAISTFIADDDLVFAHPEIGGPPDRSKVRKRFQVGARASASSGSTTCATRSAHGSRRLAKCPCARSKSGWVTATRRPP